MKLLRTMIILICICVMGYAAWNIFDIQSGYHQSDSAYSKLEEFVAPAPTAPTSGTAQTTGTSGSPAPTEPAIVFPQVDFDALLNINTQTVGWITLEDTVINYPIAQATDNDFYLHHLFDGTENDSGCIFLDKDNRADFSDRNNIIYGHNMNNGSMFNAISQYKRQDFYDAHPQLKLVTPTGNYLVDIFSGYVLSGWGDAWVVSFADDEDFSQWLQARTLKSCFRSEVVPTPEDKILTLSTCSYEFDDARFVLFGILRKQ